ncbi:XAC2610-related protein [Pedobacter jejuensis]|uniref:VCBS repeat-containing protein n=1 Tax=Pedobacter jejuensis TaxID=1268550 RepID=A0A3N0BQ04_9SPHI|nr:hypothetical protein [Pedobacter jejuensis]RNL50713.1 hypothetical protein D7004_17625 [Pedobacter jejuensis]
MKNAIIILYVFALFACNSNLAIKQNADTIVSIVPKSSEKEVIKRDSQIQGNTSDSKIFNQCDPNCVWQYHYPFADSSYVFAIQNCAEEFIDKGKTARIYFGIDKGLTDKIIWTKNIYIQPNGSGTIKYDDYNNDGVKDMLVFKETGARGSNEFYYLFLVNSKKHQLTMVQGFDDIVNPIYNKKHQVVVAYGMAGKNYYSIYKISKANKAEKIGESFEDDFNSDEDMLDNKIAQILKTDEQ